MKVTYTRNGVEYSAEVESLPEKSVAYLLQYGFSQSLQDAIAGDAKAISEKMKAEANDAGNPAPSADEIETAIKAGVAEALSDRVKAIVDGTVGDRAGFVRDPFGTMCRTIALQWLRDGLKAANAKMPDTKTDAGKAKLKELVEGVLSRNREKIEKEAHRRMKAVPAVDLAGLI